MRTRQQTKKIILILDHTYGPYCRDVKFPKSISLLQSQMAMFEIGNLITRELLEN